MSAQAGAGKVLLPIVLAALVSGCMIVVMVVYTGKEHDHTVAHPHVEIPEASGPQACECDLLNFSSTYESARRECFDQDNARARLCPVTPLGQLFTVTYGATARHQSPALIGDWRLTIDGEVSQTEQFTYADLLALGAREKEFTIACVSSSPSYKAVGNIVWSGVPLSEAMAARGQSVLSSAVEITFDLDDNYNTRIPASDWPNLWLVWKMNGETLPAARGYPLRVMTPGRYGIKNPKWVRGITFTSTVAPSYWDQNGWEASGVVLPQNWFQDRAGRTVDERQAMSVGGMAVCGSSAVDAVTVSTWKGSTLYREWTPTQLYYKGGPNAWSLWRIEMTFDQPGVYLLRAHTICEDGRATDQNVFYRRGVPLPGYTGTASLQVTVGDVEEVPSFEFCNGPGRLFCVKYEIQGEHINFDITADVTGWVSFGITTVADMMSPSDCVIASVNAEGDVIVSDRWSPDYDEPTVDALQDYEVLGGSLTDGKQRIQLRRLLVTGDPEDLPITEEDLEVIWAVHPSSPAGVVPLAKHSDFGSLTVNFFTGEVSMPPEANLVHIPIVAGAAALLFVLSVLTHCYGTQRLCASLLHQRVSPRPASSLCSNYYVSSILHMTIGEALAVLLLVGMVIVWIFVGGAALKSAAQSVPYARVLGQLNAILMALAMLPVTRSSVWHHVFFGAPYERAIKWHRRTSTSLMIVTLVHGAWFLTVRGTLTFEYNAAGYGSAYGALAALCFALMGVLAFFRRWWYEGFRLSHLLFVPAIVFAGLHSKLAGYGLIFPCVLYVVDMGVRFKKTSKCTAHFTRHGDAVAVTLDAAVDARPGQWFKITVPAISRWAHPFSICRTSAQADGPDFIIKSMGEGTWTHDLLISAETTGDIHVEGPYGQASLQVKNYRGLILVAGGVGVTPIASVLHDLINNSKAYGSLERVVLVWSSRDRSAFSAWLPWLQSIDDAFLPFTVDIALCDTATTGMNSEDTEESDSLSLPVSNGRPSLDSIFASMLPFRSVSTQCKSEMEKIKSAIRQEASFGCGVFVCGPPGMRDDALAAAHKYSFHAHTETFLL